MKLKILFIDLETSPDVSYTWRNYDTNAIDTKSHWHILSFSAKWKGGEHITKGLIDYKGYKKNKESDMWLVKDLWDLFDQADLIVAHNARFDIRKSNARFTFHGLKPPTPYKTVCTKNLAKKHFAFSSNSLNNLARQLGLGKKEKHEGFDLWLGCMSGDEKAWKKMLRYNRMDVVLLERVYNHFLPWSSNHPNLSSLLEKEICPKCSSNKLQARGYARTLANIFRRAQCQSCFGWCRFRIPEKKIKSMINL